MRRIKIQRKPKHNPHGQPGMHGMYGGYGYYGATTRLAKLYSAGKKYDVASIKKLGELIAIAFPLPSLVIGTQEDLDALNAMATNTDGKYTQAMFDLVKKIQPALDLTADGQVGPDTWKALGASDAEIPTSSSSGSSSTDFDPSDLSDDKKFSLSSLTQQVWFYPSIAGSVLLILVVALRARKKKKKSKKKVSSQMRMNRY